MQNVTGQVVVDENFFDREAEIRRFWRGLETDNLLLLAPRRVGKTSVLRRMKSTAVVNGFTGIYLDVSDCADEEHFVERLYSAVIEHHQAAERIWKVVEDSWFGRTIGRLKKVGAAGFAIELSSDELKQWARLGERLAEALAGLEGKTLIQIDELPVFVLKLLNRADETQQGRIREFLYWMRRLRQEYPNVRWMLAGSIGLDTVASRLNIADSINDLQIESLGAFDAPTAHKLLESLAKSYDVDLHDSVSKHIQARVGWLIPYYLQLIFNEIRGDSRPTIGYVDQALDRLLQPSHKGYFDYWRQRLRDELGRPDSDYAEMLLHPASRAPDGVRRSKFKLALGRAISNPEVREDKIRYLLDVLANDGYLVEEQELWRFRSPLLREYWSRRVAPPPESDDE